MKTTVKIICSLLLISSVASSCSVQYRTRHPRKKRVIVVGEAGSIEKMKIPDNATVADYKTAEAAQ